MPINKRESLLFTFIMCFCMVLWMSIYNVALQHGAINGEVVAAAWLGFPVAYVFAMCCDWFVASPLAKGFAFKYLVTPGKSSPLAMTLAVRGMLAKNPTQKWQLRRLKVFAGNEHKHAAQKPEVWTVE